MRFLTVTNNPFPKYQSGHPSGTVPQSSLLEWEHSPARLVELDVRLIDPATGEQTGPLALLAKWVQQPRHDIFKDHFILLGMHFFATNGGNLELNTQPWGMSGSLVFP